LREEIRMDETTESKDKRFLMIELSCKDHKCNPCTYPDCQRYVKLTQKPKFNVKRFEVENPSMKDEERQWIMFVELSCKDKKCNPCTYPNCQRYQRQVSGKKTFKVKTTELKDTKETKQVVEDETA
jgi:hypothetical protein